MDYGTSNVLTQPVYIDGAVPVEPDYEKSDLEKIAKVSGIWKELAEMMGRDVGNEFVWSFWSEVRPEERWPVELSDNARVAAGKLLERRGGILLSKKGREYFLTPYSCDTSINWYLVDAYLQLGQLPPACIRPASTVALKPELINRVSEAMVESCRIAGQMFSVNAEIWDSCRRS